MRAGYYPAVSPCLINGIQAEALTLVHDCASAKNTSLLVSVVRCLSLANHVCQECNFLRISRSSLTHMFSNRDDWLLQRSRHCNLGWIAVLRLRANRCSTRRHPLVLVPTLAMIRRAVNDGHSPRLCRIDPSWSRRCSRMELCRDLKETWVPMHMA